MHQALAVIQRRKRGGLTMLAALGVALLAVALAGSASAASKHHGRHHGRHHARNHAHASGGDGSATGLGPFSPEHLGHSVYRDGGRPLAVSRISKTCFGRLPPKSRGPSTRSPWVMRSSPNIRTESTVSPQGAITAVPPRRDTTVTTRTMASLQCRRQPPGAP
jgi:hypothetical protein